MAEEEEDEVDQDSDVEVVKATPITGVNQGRKRTRASHKAASISNIVSKKAMVESSIPISLQGKLAYNLHFYTREGEQRMIEFIENPIMAKKRVS